EPLNTSDARWLKLVKISYLDPLSTPRTWESAERTTRPPSVPFDGVGILALLRRPSSPTTVLLQKQFRPPVNAVTIELPAGLVDAGETAEECALRELYEETGYRGKIIGSESDGGGIGTSFLMFHDPGMTNTNMHLVEVEVDLALEENRNPRQRLEEGEFIEVFECEVGRLWEMCKVWEREGFAVDARVGTLAAGLVVAGRLRRELWGGK
ncbi:hypothetical protein EX30DRAFT_300189, partial [Ascodesmis nigricans]